MTTRARRGYYFPLSFRAAVEAVEAVGRTGVVDSEGRRLPVRFVNPRKKEGGRQTVIEWSPTEEMRLVSVLDETDESVAARCAGDAIERLGSLMKQPGTGEGPRTTRWTYVVYLDDEDGHWEVFRRRESFRDQKYRAGQKFSGAFHPAKRNVREERLWSSERRVR